jgi:S-formylglutathione hydrolase FrmB
VNSVLVSLQPDWPYDARPSRVFLDYKEQIAAALGPVDISTLMANDPYELAKRFSWPRLRLSGDELPQLYISVGEQDELLSHNRKFVELLSDLRIPYEYREVPGPHDWSVFDKQLQRVLAFQAPLIGAGGVTESH